MSSPVIFVKSIPPSSTSAPRGRVPARKERQPPIANSRWLTRKNSSLGNDGGYRSNLPAPLTASACLHLYSPSSLQFAKDRKFHLDRRDAQSVRPTGEFNNCLQIK